MAEQRSTGVGIGPHAVMFVFAEPGGGIERIKTATRMFYDLPESQELSLLLRQLEALARQYDDAAGFDPRRHMTNRADVMTGDAHYIGVAVSSVYPSVPAQLVRRIPEHNVTDATPGSDLFVRGVAVLADDTRIVMYNRGFAHPYVESTHTLNQGPYPGSQWRWATGPQGAEPGLVEVQTALHGLHLATGKAMLYSDDGGEPSARRPARRRPSHRWIGEQ
jgi:hypothetical protein